MRRITFIGATANAAALGLLGLTGAALAGPSLPPELAGYIIGSTPYTITNVFINTISPVMLSLLSGISSLSMVSSSISTGYAGDLFYAVYGTVTEMLSGISSSVIFLPSLSGAGSSSIGALQFTELLGYVFGPDVNADFLSQVSGGALPLYDDQGVLLSSGGTFYVGLDATASVPEPSGIAVAVTAVAGLAALLRRRALRRGRG